MNEREYETPMFTKTATVVVKAPTWPRGIMSSGEAKLILKHMKPPVPTNVLLVRYEEEE